MGSICTTGGFPDSRLQIARAAFKPDPMASVSSPGFTASPMAIGPMSFHTSCVLLVLVAKLLRRLLRRPLLRRPRLRLAGIRTLLTLFRRLGCGCRGFREQRFGRLSLLALRADQGRIGLKHDGFEYEYEYEHEHRAPR